MKGKLLIWPVIGLGVMIALAILYLHTFMEDVSQYSEVRPLRYQAPATANNNTLGKPMKINITTLDHAHIPDESFSELTNDSVKDFVLVTGVSHDHFQEVLDAIGIVQRMMPQYKIYLYDLGLLDHEIFQAKLFCQVIYVKFEFEVYPEHVKNLKCYAFKPIIIHDVLRLHPALVWMDASFRLLESMKNVYSKILKARGFMFFHSSPHSAYAVTDPRMYEFLPTDQEQQKRINQKGTNSIYIHKTKELYWSVVYWWSMCALDVDCFAPENSTLKCDFSSADRYNVYAGCHRYDQSALNILVSNMYGYDDKVYMAPDVVDVQRMPTLKYNVADLHC